MPRDCPAHSRGAARRPLPHPPPPPPHTHTHTNTHTHTAGGQRDNATCKVGQRHVRHGARPQPHCTRRRPLRGRGCGLSRTHARTHAAHAKHPHIHAMKRRCETPIAVSAAHCSPASASAIPQRIPSRTASDDTGAGSGAPAEGRRALSRHRPHLRCGDSIAT
jgi:hypothetical protein